MEKINAQTKIWSKLFQLQKSIKSFTNSEESEKKDGHQRSAYLYTPGSVIAQAVREQMDNLQLMLVPNIKSYNHQTIEYPVYKMINGEPRSFMKKEIYVTIETEYTWVDTESGETAGPFVNVASGANGTDKSCASAIALSERYFLLKFFHIATQDKDMEPDAHDESNLPGLRSGEQPANATQSQVARVRTAAPTPQQPLPQAAPYQASYPQPNGQAVQQQFYGPMPAQGPQYQQPVYGQQPMQQTPQVNICNAPPQYQQPTPAPNQSARFDENIPAVKEAIERLVCFEKGTSTHKQTLNECIGRLSAAGINCTENNFLNNLIEAAQARREGRPAKLS